MFYLSFAPPLKTKMPDKPTPQDPTGSELKCECGKKDCNMGLVVTEYPGKKVKIRIIDSDNIKTVVVDKKKLKEMLK